MSSPPPPSALPSPSGRQLVRLDGRRRAEIDPRPNALPGRAELRHGSPGLLGRAPEDGRDGADRGEEYHRREGCNKCLAGELSAVGCGRVETKELTCGRG